MQIKKTLKKVGAVAGSTLMVGMTMGAAQSLADFPGLFVDEDGTPTSEVVVGSDANTADVVGAVNVAAALGQDTVQTEEMTETVPGAETTSVNGQDTEYTIRSASSDISLTASHYDAFERNYEYDEDAELSVTETAGFTTSDMTEVDHNGDVRLNVGQGDVTYTARFRPEVDVEDSIHLMGEEYEVTGIQNDDDLSLGTAQTHRSLGVGDTVEHGPWSFEIIDIDRDASPQEIFVEVYNDGDFVDDAVLSSDSGWLSDDESWEIDVTRIFTGSQGDRINAETVYTDTSVNDGEEFFLDEDYTVGLTFNSNNNLTHFSLSNDLSTTVLGPDESEEDLDDGQVEAPASGEAFAGPNGYFDLENAGLTDSAEEEIHAENDMQVTWTDGHGFDYEAVKLNEALNNGVDFTEDDSGHFITPSDEGNVPLEFDVSTVDFSSSDVTVDFDYGGYVETAEFDTSSADLTISNGYDSGGDSDVGDTDVNVHNATDSGYGFQPVVLNPDGTNRLDVGVVSDGELHVWDANGQSGDAGYDNTLGNVANSPGYLETDHGAQLWASPYQVNNGDLDTIDAAVNLYALTLGDQHALTVREDPTAAENTAVSFVYENDGTSSTALDSDLDNGQVHSVHEVDDPTASYTVGDSQQFGLTDTDDGEASRTNRGSFVELASPNMAHIFHTEEVRDVHTALGEVTDEGGEDSEVTYEGVTNPDVRGALPDVARLDEEVTSSVRSGSDLILVGGPGVNSLVSNLAEDHDDVRTQSEWQNMHNDEFQVQLVEDAFTDGNHALIVAGYQAQDTRAAASYVSNWRENADELEGAAEVTRSRSEYPSQ